MDSQDIVRGASAFVRRYADFIYSALGPRNCIKKGGLTWSFRNAKWVTLGSPGLYAPGENINLTVSELVEDLSWELCFSGKLVVLQKEPNSGDQSPTAKG